MISLHYPSDLVKTHAQLYASLRMTGTRGFPCQPEISASVAPPQDHSLVKDV